ncbi:MAG TPA: hypothetical protein VN847_04990 [Streptosporangiaceae bacterium]|nr:hypothetical protein [Streptosporangiaceae bacterium]
MNNDVPPQIRAKGIARPECRRKAIRINVDACAHMGHLRRLKPHGVPDVWPPIDQLFTGPNTGDYQAVTGPAARIVLHGGPLSHGDY